METDDGLIGHGFTGGLVGGQQHLTIRDCIAREVAPLLIGNDPFELANLYGDLQRRINPRHLTGVVSSAFSAIDLALWDIRGKAANQPVWRLLGGARSEIDAYITFGHGEYSSEELVEAALHYAKEGHRRLKMVVGTNGGSTPAADAARVALVRDAIGPDVDLMVDANQLYSLPAALHFARLAEDYELGWFEEPVIANDVRHLAQLRARTRIPIAAGQNEGHRVRHLDLLLGGAVDVLQPNVCYVGGFTEAVKVAATAESFNTPIANGGGWPHHNLALQAGVPNGSLAEYHTDMWHAGNKIYVDPPAPTAGRVKLPEAPGLGLVPREEALREFVDGPT